MWICASWGGNALLQSSTVNALLTKYAFIKMDGYLILASSFYPFLCINIQAILTEQALSIKIFIRHLKQNLLPWDKVVNPELAHLAHLCSLSELTIHLILPTNTVSLMNKNVTCKSALYKRKSLVYFKLAINGYTFLCTFWLKQNPFSTTVTTPFPRLQGASNSW